MLALLPSEVFLSSFLELRLRTLHLEPVLLQAYLFSSFPAAVGLDPLVFAEMTLTHFAV